MKDEATMNFNKINNSYDSLYKFGWPVNNKAYPRDPFALIGYKNAKSDDILYRIGFYQDTG